MSQYFPKPFRSCGRNINVKFDLSNSKTKTDLKNITLIDTSSFELKTNVASLKTKVDKSDTEKLAPVPVYLSKLNDTVKNDVVKKAVYDKLVAEVNNISTSDFILKCKYYTDKTELEKKISDVSDLVKETKLIELQKKIPNSNSLATNTALTVLENEIPSVSSIVKKRDYDTKIKELEKKKLLIIIMTNKLLLQSLIFYLLMFLMQD